MDVWCCREKDAEIRCASTGKAAQISHIPLVRYLRNTEFTKAFSTSNISVTNKAREAVGCALESS